jgi:hypothetical protein
VDLFDTVQRWSRADPKSGRRRLMRSRETVRENCKFPQRRAPKSNGKNASASSAQSGAGVSKQIADESAADARERLRKGSSAPQAASSSPSRSGAQNSHAPEDGVRRTSRGDGRDRSGWGSGPGRLKALRFLARAARTLQKTDLDLIPDLAFLVDLLKQRRAERQTADRRALPEDRPELGGGGPR